MGLDVYAMLPGSGKGKGKDYKYERAPDEPFRQAGCDGLIGWPIAAEGATFRGGSYDELVERVTGQSLYDHFISVDTVRAMADRLEAFVEWIDRLDPIERLDRDTRELIAAGLWGAKDALANVDDADVIASRLFELAEEAGLLHGTEDTYAACDRTLREARMLACWFRVCAAEGFVVDGDW